MRPPGWSIGLIALLFAGAVVSARMVGGRPGRERGSSSTGLPVAPRPVASPSSSDDSLHNSADSAFADTLIRQLEGADGTVTARVSTLPPPPRDPARIAYLLDTRGPDTYLGELLAARDSMNHRWPERAEPLRVWIQEPTDAPDLPDGPARESIVRDAFGAWETTGIPLRFSFRRDSARADVHVTWVDRFESRTSGLTRWEHDQHGWIVGGSIRLAIHQPDGRNLDAESLSAIARHEVGHLIGLDHAADERNLMSARVRVAELSEADRLTVRLVYALPPGSLKRP